MKKILLLIALSLMLAIPASAKLLYEYGTFSERAEMAVEYGVVDKADSYVGNYSQNMKLLNILENNYRLGSNPFQPSGISVNIRQNLSAGAARTGTTLNIDPMITLDGHRIVFTDFNATKAYAKIDQGTDNEEIISFTGITDNTTYYTLTGCDWGYNFYNTATSTSNYKRHTSGASIIITNDWHFINDNYLSLTSAQTISGIKTYTVSPIVPTPTTDYQASTKKYVDDSMASGASPIGDGTAGIGKTATREQAAAGTSDDGTYRYLLPSSMATSTSQVATTSIPVTGTDGKLDQSFFDLTEDFTFSGTTTIANSIFSVIPKIPVADPTNSADAISKNYFDSKIIKIDAYKHTQTSITVGSGSTHTILYKDEIGTMGANDTLVIRGSFTENSSGGNITFGFNIGDGSATSTISWAKGTDYDNITFAEIRIMNRNSTSAQYITFHLVDSSGTVYSGGKTGTLNTTNSLRFQSTFLNSAQDNRVVTQEFFDAIIYKP